MTARSLPIVIATVIVVGGGFTLAVNELLGGSINEAPVRAASAARSAPLDETEAPGDRAPVAYDNPRRLRNPAAGSSVVVHRRKASHSRRSRHSHKRATSRSPVPSSPSTPAPSTPAPTSSPPSSRPAASPKPSPSKKKSGGSGGGFYSTG